MGKPARRARGCFQGIKRQAMALRGCLRHEELPGGAAGARSWMTGEFFQFAVTGSEPSGLETYPELAGESSFALCSSGGADPAVAGAWGAVCPPASVLVAGGGWGQGASVPRRCFTG